MTVTATNFPVPSPFTSNVACWETVRGPDFPGDAIFYSDPATREGFGVTNGFHFGNAAPFTATVNNNGLATITCTQRVAKYGPTPSGGVCPLSAQQLAAGDRCAFSLGVSDGTVNGTVVRSEAITLK